MLLDVEFWRNHFMNFTNTDVLGVKFKMLDTILYKRSIYDQKPDVLTFT